jgi:hypothetical protein
MVEPSRKIEKDNAASNLHVVATSPRPSPDSLEFVTSHSTHPGKIDLLEFVKGANEPADPRQRKRWGGPFTGRPELLLELLPHIHAEYGAAKKTSCLALHKMLRAYWRLLDRCDALPESTPVKSVADLTSIHEATQLRDGIHSSITYGFVRLANAARQSKNLPLLYWAVSEKGTGEVKDTLERQQVRAVYNVLKDRVRSIYTAWEHDAALVPSRTDVQDILYLFLVKTGWNEATAMNIDIDDYVRPHPTDPERHILHSAKARALGVEQHHTGRNREQWAPANLISKLIERTEPLRRLLRTELSRLEDSVLKNGTSDDSSLRMAWLRNAIRSPWLGLAAKGVAKDLRRIDSGNSSTRVVLLDQLANTRRSTIDGLNPVERVVRDANFRLPEDKRIGRMTLSDLRDAFIGFAYESSGYQWLMAKLAGGHESIRSAISYLRSRRFKAHGEGQIRKLGNALFSEIKSRKQVDPAILFALVQRGEITEEQRKRWEAGKDRTRMGTGCRDFKHPPKRVAPEHVEGTGCRIQRCTLCHHAIVFSDSLSHLARRAAELVWIKREIPVSVWIASDFSDEQEELEGTLEQFPSDEVQKHTAKWLADIKAGLHRPMMFEGSYV